MQTLDLHPTKNPAPTMTTSSPGNKDWPNESVKTLSKTGGNLSQGFTLLEMLVVITIVSLLLVAVVPAVNSLSKSGGRKGAVSNLGILVEQARSLALTDGRNTYITFATDLPSADNSYRTYAVFEDDSSGTAHAIQVTKWQRLPTGISFRSQNESSGTGTSLTAAGNKSLAIFPYPDVPSPPRFPYIQFDPTGSVAAPTSAAPMRLVIFEGFVQPGGTEVPTGKDSNGQPRREEIQIGRFSGRAKYVVQ